MRRRKVVPIGFPEERLGELRSALERNGVQVSDGDPNCDAIVVWVDAETRLGEVASIRRARLDLPIVVLAPRDDQDFLDRADGAGATRVLRASGSTDEVAGSLATVLSSGTLARDLKTQTRWTLSQPHPVPVGVWTSGADAPPFRPILVEDDADQRFFMMRAFRKRRSRVRSRS